MSTENRARLEAALASYADYAGDIDEVDFMPPAKTNGTRAPGSAPDLHAAPTMSSPQFDVEIEGPGAPRARQLERRRAVLDRPDQSCAVVLGMPSISRRHLGVELVENGILVTDASSNGSLVNELLLHRSARVVAGAEALLQVGPCVVRVRALGRAASAAEGA